MQSSKIATLLYFTLLYNDIFSLFKVVLPAQLVTIMIRVFSWFLEGMHCGFGVVLIPIATGRWFKYPVVVCRITSSRARKFHRQWSFTRYFICGECCCWFGYCRCEVIYVDIVTICPLFHSPYNNIIVYIWRCGYLPSTKYPSTFCCGDAIYIYTSITQTVISTF